MSNKKTLKSWHGIVAGDMSGNLVSDPTHVLGLDNLGIQLSWLSSNAVGVITIEGSNDYDKYLGTGTFYPLTFSPVLTQPASNNGGYLVNLRAFPWVWLRVKYTRTSGSGTFDVWISGKAL